MTTLQLYKELFSKCATLSPELKQKAKDELHETEEKSESMVKELRKLIQENRESKELGELVADRFIKADYDTLLRFIRARKFDVTRAYALLQGYVSYRQRYPALMENLTLESIKTTILKGYPTLIPARTAEGYVVLMFDIGEWKPETCLVDDIMRACLFVLEMLLLNEATQIHGIVFIENYNKFSFKQMFALTPSDMRKIVDMMQGSFPSRFKGVHVINQPWYFNIPFRIMKTFMNKKLASRIFVHGYNLESFKKKFDVDVLPKEYGGIGPDYDPNVLIQALEETCDLDG